MPAPTPNNLSRAPKNTSRSRARAVAAWIALVPAAACIIADPPAELPKPPAFRPTIVHAQATPSPSRILTRLPPTFEVPVEVLDPTVTFEWRVFIDFDPLDPPRAPVFGVNEPDVLRPEATIRTVSFGVQSIAGDLALKSCHVIEFLVAYSFPSISNHTPDSRGGDVITWFYNPAGDLRGCPVYDGGALPDAADGSE